MGVRSRWPSSTPTSRRGKGECRLQRAVPEGWMDVDTRMLHACTYPVCTCAVPRHSCRLVGLERSDSSGCVGGHFDLSDVLSAGLCRIDVSIGAISTKSLTIFLLRLFEPSCHRCSKLAYSFLKDTLLMRVKRRDGTNAQGSAGHRVCTLQSCLAGRMLCISFEPKWFLYTHHNDQCRNLDLLLQPV